MSQLQQMESGYPLVDFKKRSDIHWARKVWHILTVALMAIAYAYLPYSVALTILAVAWVLFVPIDFLRQKTIGLNDFLTHLFKPIMRDSETNSLAGTTYLLSGVGLIVLVFPRDIVQLSLWFLAFADPIASYFGIRYGRDKIFGHKSMQGSLAAFLVCALLTALFLSIRGILADRLLIVSLLGGVIGALAELIPIGKLDDNFTLPILSSVFLWLLFLMFGAASSYV